MAGGGGAPGAPGAPPRGRGPRAPMTREVIILTIMVTIMVDSHPPAKVPAVEPVPVLKLGPRLPPTGIFIINITRPRLAFASEGKL